ncbi:MAG: RibD family protein [Actinomycetales bacterium]
MVATPDRGFVVLSAAMSLDGHVDDDSPDRLILSGPEDLDEVDALRASCDAIVVGAGTVRADDPRLVVRSAARRAARVARGRPATPLRVVLSRSGDLPLGAALFRVGGVGGVGGVVVEEPTGPPLVLVPGVRLSAVRAALSGVAEVAPAGPAGDPEDVLAELTRRGARRVLVEGGTTVTTAFLAAGVVDELRLAVAPFLLGRPAAPRLVGPGTFPAGPGSRARLREVRRVGDMAVLRYDLRRP